MVAACGMRANKRGKTKLPEEVVVVVVVWILQRASSSKATKQEKRDNGDDLPQLKTILKSR